MNWTSEQKDWILKHKTRPHPFFICHSCATPKELQFKIYNEHAHESICSICGNDNKVERTQHLPSSIEKINPLQDHIDKEARVAKRLKAIGRVANWIINPITRFFPKSKPTMTKPTTLLIKGAKLRNKLWLPCAYIIVTNPDHMILVQQGHLAHLQVRVFYDNGTEHVRCLHNDAAQEENWYPA